MVQKAITSYYDLLDQRIKEGTLIILVISFLVFSVGVLSHDAGVYKSNIAEYKNTPTIIEDDIVTIDGTQYKVILQELK